MPKSDSSGQTQDIRSFLNDYESIIETRQKKEASKQEKLAANNKLTPTERLATLIDPKSPFLEISALAGYKMHDDKDGLGCGGGYIAGIGLVQQRACAILISNYTIKGGAISPAGVKKILRLYEVASQNKLPVVILQESAGANLLYQSEVFIPGGEIFANQARLSARGIPQVTVVHGSSTAGGAYIPGLSDYSIMVKNQGKIFLAGPPLVKEATGEVIDDESLGGSALHSEVAGTVDYVAEDDRDGIYTARDIIAGLDWPIFELPNDSFELKPVHDPNALLDSIPADYKTPYDSREIIRHLVDNSAYEEFKAEFDPYTLCGFGELFTHKVGIISNNGPITEKGAVKAAHFIQLCDQGGIDLVFIQNTTGYMVGSQAEAGGIVKHGSKMLQAVANARVHKLTLVVGGSFGAGNYGMCGRGLSPDFIFSWPNAKTAVMGAEQAAGVMGQITAAQFKAKGEKEIEKKVDALKQSIIEKMTGESHALFATARLWDDGIIDPRDSRNILGLALQICKHRKDKDLNANTFGVARL